MSFWTDIRHPVIMGPVGGLYDYATDQGAFEGNAYHDPNFDPIPNYPNYIQGYDPQSMSVQGINPDMQGMDAYRKEALRNGPSAWSYLAEDKSRADEAGARDMLSNEAAGGTATARSALAQRGGLSSGAAERVGTEANKAYLSGSQGLSKQGELNRMQIGVNDEQNRIAQLGALPGMENELAQFNLNKANTDINRQLQERQRQSDYNLALYNTQAQTIAANNQARATAAAGSGGSWICTEARKKGGTAREWDSREKNALNRFKQYAIKKHRHVAKFYLFSCNELINRMNQEKIDWAPILDFVKYVIFYIECGEMDKAFLEYFCYTRDLIARYWPDCQNEVYLAYKKGAVAA